MNVRFISLCLIILSLALYRVFPHIPNVSPVAAMALFGGAYFADRKIAIIIPFVALFISDLIIGLHSTMVFVYVSFALAVLIGYLIREKLTTGRIAVATVSSSMLFFLITNFGAWLGHGMYPMTMEGLLQAYVAGIPFLHYTLVGDLFFSLIVFGGFSLLQKNVLSDRPAVY